ncbi:MAG: NUDIX domain-containing protein [Flavimaricola sp.]|nr:NUDIX domain-containing protein [Flavimaricola sp.]
MALFLYGTLRHRPLFDRVAGSGTDARCLPATLADHAVDRVQYGTLPMLVSRLGSVAMGEVWFDLTERQRARLDLYEVAFGYTVIEVALRLGDGRDVVADAYAPPPWHVPSGEPWSLPEWEPIGAEAACFAADEIDTHDPPLSGDQLFVQWRMMEHRAQASVRASRLDVPATRRRAGGPEDYVVRPAAPLAGDFFKFAGLSIDHRRFDGAWATGLKREVLVGADAALVLPYDPVRDRVLLIEQFRNGPARRSDPNPWCLEPVAGIVDAGETPEDAAHREAAEEAGVTFSRLDKMFSVYASPGSSTDFFHCYLGLTDLPPEADFHGGLPEEGEDLRSHVMPLDAALDLVDTGEVNVAPLVAMLLWLARHRGRLSPG